MLCWGKMPDFEIENNINGLSVGVDEAGRGPWAGPVVAGAVLFKNKNLPNELICGLDDSKKLSAKKREKLYEMLFNEQNNGNLEIGIGQASAREIDELNILQATFVAMKRAVSQIKTEHNAVLVDGNQNPKCFNCQTQTCIGGDAKSLSIAAASIVAKVYRDRLMKQLAEKYPYYAFEKNAGYGTKAHVEGLKAYGITPEHRLSYKPVKLYLTK